MIGHDLKQIGQLVTIEGKEYNLVIDMNALIDLDDKFRDTKIPGVSDDLSGVDKAFQLLIRSDLKTVRFFFYIALRHSDESITEKEAGKILGSTNLVPVTRALVRAMTESIPEPDEKKVPAPEGV